MCRTGVSILLLPFFLVPVPPTAAQTLPDSTVAQLLARLARLDSDPLPQLRVGFPGIGLTTPTALGGRRGDVSVGASIQRIRYSDGADGAIGLAAAVGDPDGLLGVDVALAILDLRSSGGRGGFGRRGALSFKAHRLLDRGRLAVAVGTDNTLTWGEVDTPPSVYAVVTRGIRLASSQPGEMYVSAGVGTGYYRTEPQDTSSGEGLGVFASTTFLMSGAMSTTLEWTGQDIGIGASLAPFRAVPIALSVGFADVSGRAGDGPRPFLSVGYGLSLTSSH